MLSNLESINAVLIHHGWTAAERVSAFLWAGFTPQAIKIRDQRRAKPIKPFRGVGENSLLAWLNFELRPSMLPPG
jgi:hypothetical protein